MARLSGARVKRVIASPVPGPDEIMALHELQLTLHQVIGSLTPREALTVRRYFGLDGGDCTYDELGREMGISRSRVKQIVDKALRKLRHPSRCRLLRPHATLSREREKELKAAEDADRLRAAEALREQEQRLEEQRARNSLRFRIGEEIGVFGLDAHWSDTRREQIAEALDQVSSEIVTQVRSRDELYDYVYRSANFDYSWKVYEAWKRDVRKRIGDYEVTFTRAKLISGGYLIYARKDRRTWYLFEPYYGHSYDNNFRRWIGYAEVGDLEARRGRVKIDQSLRLVISKTTL